ncbi:MAG: 2Fe-2S iron-sulfur cluster-binding protein [Lachnospira sp.]
MRVKIKRQNGPNKKYYWQTFLYEGEKNVSVAHVLERLNYDDDLFDIDGKPAKRISWECSCMQKMCGACAMIINGVPALACNYFINESKDDLLVLEPLKKFPVICDLVVDRSAIQEMLLRGRAFYQSEVSESPQNHKQRYDVSKCLKCGLCLEVCPNYAGGRKFFGAVYANDAFMIASGNADDIDIRKKYHKHFENGCSKSLACMKVCPMDIPTLSSIALMNKR